MNRKKRLFDIIFSSLMLIGLSPVFALIALGIVTTSPGGAIYRQERIGKNYRPFVMYKFRTMTKDAEKSGPRLALPRDARVTPFGRFLRRHHLDELPQFLNVLKGEMSLIGPRPERDFFIKEIEEKFPDYRKLLAVKPGITSLGMVKYGYASESDGMIERARIDMDYLENRTVKMEAQILGETVKAIIKGKGI